MKDEIFEIKLKENPSTGYYWEFINNKSFINIYIERVNNPKRLLDENNNNENEIPLVEIEEVSEDIGIIYGGSSISNEYYKALKTSKEPLILNYGFFTHYGEIVINNTINLNICNKLDDGKCIIETEESELNKDEESEKEEKINKIEENEKEEEKIEEKLNKDEKNNGSELENNEENKIEKKPNNDTEKINNNFNIIHISFSLFYLLLLF